MAQVQKATEEKPKVNLRYQRDKEREMVRGMFKYYECPNGEIEFVFRKYKQDPVERYRMVDNEIYTIPLGVAMHLNNDGYVPVHAYTLDENGKPIQRVGHKVKRYSFESLEFKYIEELTPSKQIMTVENLR